MILYIIQYIDSAIMAVKRKKERQILFEILVCVFVSFFFLVVVVVEFFSDYCFSEFLTLTTILFKSKVNC